MTKKRVFNVGDTVIIHSREYGTCGIETGVIENWTKGSRYGYVVKTDSDTYELCAAEMRKVSAGPKLNVLEDWS